MHWTVAAPFFNQPGTRWIDDFTASGRHRFTKVLRPPAAQSWHQRASRATPGSEWLAHLKQGRSAWQQGTDGCITVFPQLALTVGVQQLLSLRDRPLLAWCFNIGALYPGIRRAMARRLLSRVSTFVVHSTAECEAISRWLGIPRERVVFVPLQRAAIVPTHTEDQEQPFVLALGSAQRDYASLFAAVEKLGLRTVVVAGAHAVEGLRIPANVELRSNLNPVQCHHLAQQARLNVVPLLDNPTAAGQVTIVEAMRMGRAVISTQVVGSQDYIVDGHNGLFVPPGDVPALTAAIDGLWRDDATRQAMASAAAEHAARNFSDEVAAQHLEAILEGLA